MHVYLHRMWNNSHLEHIVYFSDHKRLSNHRTDDSDALFLPVILL